MKKTVLVRSDHLNQIAQILTGYGSIDGIDHEGTILYSLENDADDAFELGRKVSDIEAELRSYDIGFEIISAPPKKRKPREPVRRPRAKR